MQVTKEVVKRTAENARLELSDKEIARFTDDFNEILEVFKALDKIDVKDVPLSLQPIELKDALREDKPKQCLSQEEALSNAKNKQDGYFKGPKV
jgi:aspartyl-tRNA(Asn)/glutamyl-tRNA(Gln) amidotransferase subunit C